MRRSRYTVTMQDGSKEVILAYSGSNADSFFRERGYAIDTVVKGDYRLASVASSDGWRLNSENLAEAVAFFGIKLPITIKQTPHANGRYGAHQLRASAGPPRHHITVKSWLTPEQAGRTLWHELTHAMQVERVCKGDYSREGLIAWRRTPERRGSYERRPIEVEARSYEPFNDELPLAGSKR